MTVRVRLGLHCEHPHPLAGGHPIDSLAAPHNVEVDERWTLARHGAGWLVVATDLDPLAGSR